MTKHIRETLGFNLLKAMTRSALLSQSYLNIPEISNKVGMNVEYDGWISQLAGRNQGDISVTIFLSSASNNCNTKIL